MKFLTFLMMLLASACHVDSGSETQTTSVADASESSGSGQPATLTVDVSDDGVALRVDGEEMLFRGGKEHRFVGEHIVRGGWNAKEETVDPKVKEMLRFAYAALGMLTGLYKDYRHGRHMPDNVSLQELKSYLVAIDTGIKELLTYSRERWQTDETVRSKLLVAFKNLEMLLAEDRLVVYGISYDELFDAIGGRVVEEDSTVARCMRPLFGYYTKKSGDVVSFHRKIVGEVIEESGFRGKKVAEVTEESVETIFGVFYRKSIEEEVKVVGQIEGKKIEESYTKKIVTTFAKRYRDDSSLREKFVEYVATKQVETRNTEEAGVTIRGFIDKDYQGFRSIYREKMVKEQTIAILNRVMAIEEDNQQRRLREDILADGYWSIHIAKVLDLLMDRKEVRNVSKDHLRRLARILAKAMQGVTAGNF